MSDRDLEAGLTQYLKRAEDAARRGMALAGMRLLADCDGEEPMIPREEGTLAGSGSVFVDNELVGTSEDAGVSGDGTPSTELSDPVSPNTIVVSVGFNSPYAAYQHEGVRDDGTHAVDPANYTNAGTGPKFLEAKLQRNRERYMKIVAAEIRKVN